MKTFTFVIEYNGGYWNVLVFHKDELLVEANSHDLRFAMDVVQKTIADKF